MSPNQLPSDVLAQGEHPDAHPSTRPAHLARRAGAAAALCVLLVAAACGGNSESGGGGGDESASRDEPADAANCPLDALEQVEGVTEITVWHAYNSLTQETLEQAAAEYNASQDTVQVSVEAQGTYPELLKKYEDSLGNPAGLPDVIFSEDTTLQFMVDSGSVIPASDCIAADPDASAFYDDLLEPVATSYTVGERLWAAAYGVSMPIMYVNNDHLSAAGLSTDEYPGTLEEVRAAAEKLKAANIPDLEAPVVMQLYGWYPENWLTGAQQLVVDEDNGRSALATASEFDNETTTEIIEWMDQMEADGLLKAYPYSSDITQFLAMGNGSASILIDGSRAITAVDAVVGGGSAGEIPEGESIDPDQVAGLDVNVAPVPGVDEPGQGAVWGSAAFLIAGDDDAKVAAGWEFLQYFNSTPVQTQWLLNGSYLPVTQAVQDAPEVQALFTDTRAGQWLAIANSQLLSIDPSFPGPAIGPYNEFRAGLHAMLDDVVLGSAEPAAAIEEFNSAFQDDLSSYADEVGG
ncbi:MAG: extracellular solute-binding protein [Microthrixaceae bacterium]